MPHACGRIGSLQHSADGRFVYVGDAGDVIDTARARSVANLEALHNSRVRFRGRLGRRQAGISASQLDSTACHRTQLPPPLPPETRTVGQLVAESLRLYGARFWPSLALGIGPVLSSASRTRSSTGARAIRRSSSSPARCCLPASYAGAVALVRPIGRGRYVAVALAVGLRRVLAALPVAALDLPRDLPAGARRGSRSSGSASRPRSSSGAASRTRSARRAARARRLRPRARLARDARDHDLPHRSRALLLVARAERPGDAGRRRSWRSSCSRRSSCSAPRCCTSTRRPE